MSDFNKHIVVVGGGAAGCIAAGKLARNGYRVTVMEKDDLSGGKVNRWFQLFPDRRKGSEVTSYLNEQISHPDINLELNCEVSSIKHHGEKIVVTDNKNIKREADAVLIATGFDLFDARRKEEYGYGIYDNVITSAELEDMFSRGSVLTAEGRVPGRIGIVHCVGSRDEKVGNFHCSKVCCVTAVKQAIELREKLPGTEVFCFYMDMRMFGSHYEELYRESQEKWHVNYIRGKVSEAGENIDKKLVVKVEDTLAGRPLKMTVDLLVLMVGMENSATGHAVGKNSGLSFGVNNFFKVNDNHYGNNQSGVKGLFYAGSCTGPMNIPDTISHARAAVGEIESYLGKN